jgi:heme ABC exporter ATP-binding subunit CcmA
MALSVRLRAAVALAGQYPVLAGADLDVRHGEILVLTGPNGAGKTSLLRVLAGLLPLAAGDAEVLGLDPTAEARALRPLVGLLGHKGGLYDDLSAEQNVRFVARAARAPAGTTTEALQRVGFGPRLRAAQAGKLSAGQRRRLALACLLAKKPLLWLLDEPHAGLDTDSREALDSLLRQLAGEGLSVVLASHEQQVKADLADRVVAMVGGTVLAGTLPASPPAVTKATLTGAKTPTGGVTGVAAPDVTQDLAGAMREGVPVVA